MMCTGCTKKEPIVVGKPAEFMLENIANAFGMERKQICMVGDRLDTDILFGQDGGLSTMLVLSGVTLTTYLNVDRPSMQLLLPGYKHSPRFQATASCSPFASAAVACCMLL